MTTLPDYEAFARAYLAGEAEVAVTTLVAYLKGVCHASFSTIRKFFRDVLNLTIARSELAKVIQRVSKALAEPYAELLQALPKAPLW